MFESGNLPDQVLRCCSRLRMNGYFTVTIKSIKIKAFAHYLLFFFLEGKGNSDITSVLHYTYNVTLLLAIGISNICTLYRDPIHRALSAAPGKI